MSKKKYTVDANVELGSLVFNVRERLEELSQRLSKGDLVEQADVKEAIKKLELEDFAD